jgi:pimeloyl-ACP methyl ester carboxylesterase
LEALPARNQRAHLNIAAVILAITFGFLAPVFSKAQISPAALSTVQVGDGITLHYQEQGQGSPVVFVHGSLSDLSYWDNQLPLFAQAHFHVISYSRRYNPPNVNPTQPGYSAIVDADDLAALITKLKLGRVDIVGHSYGALTALFLAVRHPELVHSMVLCEAPAVSLLGHLPDSQSASGKATLADIERRMVSPMQEDFRKGDREAGVRTFLDYVLNDPQAWDKLPKDAQQETLKNAHEWDVMLTTGELFPELDPRAVQKIHIPVLLLSGEKSYPFLGTIDGELERLLPNNRRIILRGLSHRMWFEDPDVCRKTTLDFLKAAE